MSTYRLSFPVKNFLASTQPGDTLWALLFSFFLLRLHQVPLWRNWFSYFSSTAASFITNLNTGALLSPGNGQLLEDRHKDLST